MRELVEEHGSAPHEPRSVRSRDRLLYGIDAEIEELSDILDHEEELRNRAALAIYRASHELEANFRLIKLLAPRTEKEAHDELRAACARYASAGEGMPNYASARNLCPKE